MLFWQTGTLNWAEINCACKWPIKSVYLEASYALFSAPFNAILYFLVPDNFILKFVSFLDRIFVDRTLVWPAKKVLADLPVVQKLN